MFIDTIEGWNAQSESDQDVVANVRVGSGNGRDTDNKLAHAHPESTVEKERSSTELLDHVDTGNGCVALSAIYSPRLERLPLTHANVDDTSGDSDKVGRRDTSLLEVGGTVVYQSESVRRTRDRGNDENVQKIKLTPVSCWNI